MQEPICLIPFPKTGCWQIIVQLYVSCFNFNYSDLEGKETSLFGEWMEVS